MYGIMITATKVRTTRGGSALRDYVRWEYGPGADPGFLLTASRRRVARPRGGGLLRRIRAWAARPRTDATPLAAKAVE